MWNSANAEAFRYTPIPDEHKQVILEQWEWLQEPVKLPGSYMQEREISNVWNKIVFDGENPRTAIDDAINIINREITRKMEEFGYLRDGVKVKEFRVPSIELVESWIEAAKLPHRWKKSSKAYKSGRTKRAVHMPFYPSTG